MDGIFDEILEMQKKKWIGKNYNYWVSLKTLPKSDYYIYYFGEYKKQRYSVLIGILEKDNHIAHPCIEINAPDIHKATDWIVHKDKNL